MNSEKPARILIVDDHEVVRKGLHFFLSSQPDIEVVGEAANGLEALHLVEQLQPDVMLMDLVMPEMDGLEALKIIRTRHPEIEILVLTNYVDNDKVYRAIQLGATGYLMKDTNPQELARAIRAAVRGEVYLHPEAARRLANVLRSQESPEPSVDVLTEREIEVLQLVARGLSNQEIADDLSISLKTVKSHVSSILSKLGLSSRVHAALYALRRGIIPLDSI
jgi:DNA-binding NarL/FixJ family response regulator